MVAHCQVHARKASCLPRQINLIYYYYYFVAVVFLPPRRRRLMSQSLLLACPTSIHHHSVDDGLAVVRCAFFLTRSNFSMHSNWPLLHRHTNRDAEREGETEGRRKKKKRENSFLIVVTTGRPTQRYTKA